MRPPTPCLDAFFHSHRAVCLLGTFTAWNQDALTSKGWNWTMEWIRPQMTITPSFLDEADCVVCNRDLFLSAIVCEACGRVACGHHAGSVCACGGNKKIVYRAMPQELKDLAFVCCRLATTGNEPVVAEV